MNFCCDKNGCKNMCDIVNSNFNMYEYFDDDEQMYIHTNTIKICGKCFIYNRIHKFIELYKISHFYNNITEHIVNIIIINSSDKDIKYTFKFNRYDIIDNILCEVDQKILDEFSRDDFKTCGLCRNNKCIGIEDNIYKYIIRLTNDYFEKIRKKYIKKFIDKSFSPGLSDHVSKWILD